MISAVGFVHVAFIFAITAIVLFQLKNAQPIDTWIPILAALAGYLFPPPTFEKKTRATSNSMLDISNAVPLQAYNEAEEMHAPKLPVRISMKADTNPPSLKEIASVLPTVALFGAALTVGIA